MEALLSWRGVMFLTHTLICAQRHAHTVDMQRRSGTSIGVHHTNMQADTCAYTPNPHVYTHRQTYTHGASHLSIQALDVCGVCIFSHAICWYSFSKPLAAWCVQLHCRFISLPTQQSLISPSGSYTAQHMIALCWGGGGYFRRDDRMGGGSTHPHHSWEKM